MARLSTICEKSNIYRQPLNSEQNSSIDGTSRKASTEAKCHQIGISSTNPPLTAENSLQKTLLNDLENGAIPKLKQRGLKFAHLNIHSLVSKIDELRYLLKNSPFDVIGLNETLCDSLIPNSELLINDYVLLRRDRNRHGGGIAVYVSNKFDYKMRDDLNIPDLECLWFELHYPNKSPVLVGEFYRPPNSKTDFFETFDKNLDSAVSQNLSCIILGDFNCNFMPDRDNCNAQKIAFYTNMYGLHQLIDEATRVTDTTCTTIDLIFVSDKELYKETGIFRTSISDHYLIYTIRDFKANVTKTTSCAEYRSFKHFNEDKFLDELRKVPWHICRDIENIDLTWNTWLNLFMNVVDKHIPKRKKRIRKKACPWITKEIIDIMKERDNILKAAKRDKISTLWNTYKSLKNKVTHLMKIRKREYFSNLILRSNNNSKSVWKCLKDILPTSSEISPHVINVNGANVTDSTSIANAFNDFFTTNAVNITKDIPRPPYCKEGYQIICNANDDCSQFTIQPILLDFVIKEIDHMSIDKATGEDGISCKILKLSKHVIAQSLTDIINKSLNTGVVPRAWKLARVVPIFKSGDTSCLNNYRPISILPIVSKIIEKAVHKQLTAFLDNSKILHPNQSGFRAMHSTSTVLTKLVNQWSLNVENKQLTGVAFIDLRKAFDTVDHELLLSKLRSIGCAEGSVKWFESYLSNRRQITNFKDKKSSSLFITMGVPQGSILGPLLFSVYVNSLPNCTKSGVIDMYADDTTLSVYGPTAQEVEQKLSAALSEVMTWITKNRLVLNSDKTCVMVIGSRANLKKVESFNVYLNNTLLNRVHSTKCLGVVIDEELNWSKHVDKVTKTTQRNVGVIKRAKTYLPQSSLKLLYNSLVMPHFDYCSPVWSNRYQSQTNQLFKVQKRAARLIMNQSYETPSVSLFKSLKWMTLEERFEFNRVLMIYKCLHNLAPPYLSTELVNPCQIHEHFTRITTSGELSLPKFKSDCYKNSPIVSSVRSWNMLSRLTREAITVCSFKSLYKRSCVMFDTQS